MQLKPVTKHDVTINNECIWFCHIMGFRLVTHKDCCEMNANKYKTAFCQHGISNIKECLITGSQIIRHLLHYAVTIPRRLTSTCYVSRQNTFTSHFLEETVLTSCWASIMNSISKAAMFCLSEQYQHQVPYMCIIFLLVSPCRRRVMIHGTKNRMAVQGNIR